MFRSCPAPIHAAIPSHGRRSSGSSPTRPPETTTATRSVFLRRSSLRSPWPGGRRSRRSVARNWPPRMSHLGVEDTPTRWANEEPPETPGHPPPTKTAAPIPATFAGNPPCPAPRSVGATGVKGIPPFAQNITAWFKTYCMGLKSFGITNYKLRIVTGAVSDATGTASQDAPNRVPRADKQAEKVKDPPPTDWERG